ncbi:MAG: shikimate kinase, partial [Longimicrobiales bacterium]|nr:shikimate kinase [Longimicrobiales bacterium]
AVLATGGGWGAVEGRLEELPGGTFSVWLRIGPEEAVRRAAAQDLGRPLLAVNDPMERARELLAQREQHYRTADLSLDAEDASPEELARRIVTILEKKSNER